MTDHASLSDVAVGQEFLCPSSFTPLRMRRAPGWLSADVVTGTLRGADLLIIFATGAFAYFARFSTIELGGLPLLAHTCAVMLAANIFQVFGLYRFDELVNSSYQSRQLLVAWTATMLCLIALGFVTKTASEASRLWMGLWFTCGYVALLSCRALFKCWIWRWQRVGYLTRNVVVVGAGKHVQRIVEQVRRYGNTSGTRLIGQFDGSMGHSPSYGVSGQGTATDLENLIRQHLVDQVIFALPWEAESESGEWIKKLKTLPVDVWVCPDLGEFHLRRGKVAHLADLPLLNVFEKPLTGWNCIVKTMEDRLLAGLILPLIAPIMGAIALAIKLDSPGPILFKQKRYGFNNEVIEVFKFRSMYHDGVQDGSKIEQATKNDERMTRVGRFIRRTSLDELPQFLNVLKGDMSIVGPRPHAVVHNELYARRIDEYVGRHRVKPGITGWAQVNGLRGETETLEKMERRVCYDLYYIENWSLLFDLRIILKTLIFGFVGPKAY